MFMYIHGCICIYVHTCVLCCYVHMLSMRVHVLHIYMPKYKIYVHIYINIYRYIDIYRESI